MSSFSLLHSLSEGGDVFHGGGKPKTHNFRIVLNINWVDKDYE